LRFVIGSRRMNKKRTHQIIFRLSEKETNQLKSKISLSGYNQQEYLRRVALDKTIINTDGIKEIIPEMKRQGNNLNQIAKQLNKREYVDYNGVLKTTLEGVQDVWQSLRQYLRALQ